ncbi:MAG: iron chelate uptake ABC transporter family permease subunit, partial [Bacteroidota bacterium]
MESIKRLNFQRFIFIIFLLSVLLLIVSIAALVVGPTSISIPDLYAAFFSSQINPLVTQIIFEIRLPRILFAVAVGGGLSISGAVFQAMLLNPLAEPYILGISSGGTFGAVLSFLLGLSFIGTQAFAFGG